MERQELKGRGTHLNVSKFSAGKGCSIIIAFLFGAWGLGLIYLIVTQHGIKLDVLSIPIFFFGSCLFIGSLYLVFQALRTEESHFNTSYSEHKRLKKARWSNIFGLFFMIVFCSMFILVGIYGKQIMFFIMGSIFLLISVVGIHGMFKSEIKIKRIKKHGTTYLKTNSSLYLGHTCKFSIQNNSRELQSKEINIKLRYIEEIYEAKKKKKGSKSKSTLKIFYSSELETTTKLRLGESETFQFTLPEDGQLTDLDFKEPKYWELVCSLDESNYFARFILDVNS